MVYRARQPDLDRSVVIKVLTNLDAETTRRRFNRERRAMGRLSQARGIAPLYGSGFTPAGQPYLLMPFYEQGSLQERIVDGPELTAHEVRDIGVAIATAVQTAHENGVLHRDLKPANILMTRAGRPDVADFGIAHLVDDALGTSQALTMTPLYTAPEVFDGVESGALGDVYSLGATVYAMLQGYPAYSDPAGNTPVLSLMRRINEDPLPTLPEHVSTGIAAVVVQAMSKDPTQRQTSAGEFASQLAAADMSIAAPSSSTQSGSKQSGSTQSGSKQARTRRSPGPMAAVAVLVAAIAGAAILAFVMLGGDKDSRLVSNGSDSAVVSGTAAPDLTGVAEQAAIAGPDATSSPFDQIAAAQAARQVHVRVEAYSCAGVEVATGVILDDSGVVVTTPDVLDSPWYIVVSSAGALQRAQPLELDVAEGFGLIEIDQVDDNSAARFVTVANGAPVALVGIDGRPAMATVLAPDDDQAPLQAQIDMPGDGNAVEPIDVAVADSGAIVGIASVSEGLVEILTPAEVMSGSVVAADYDCSPASTSELSALDTESVVSPSIVELLTMQQLSDAYAAERWTEVRRLEPAKRVYTDQQFINGWRPLRQGFIFPVDRQIDDQGLARWRIGLIGYETWNADDLTTLFCLTWTVDPSSGRVVQTNEDNVLIHGSQPGQQQRRGFIRPAALISDIEEKC